MFECKVCGEKNFFQSFLLSHMRAEHGFARRGLVIEVTEIVEQSTEPLIKNVRKV